MTLPSAPLSTRVASDDPFAIYAKGIWTLRGDALRLTEKPELVTTSLAVAAVFGKRHDTVLRAIRNMECSEEFSHRNFAVANYLDEQGKPRKMVEMNRLGFDFLVLGFTGKKAAMFREAYVQRFHAMEDELLKKTNEIERLARFREHMPALDTMEYTEGKRYGTPRRIVNPDFQPIPGVKIVSWPRC